MFLHSYQPDAILLDLGIWKIHWYGFLIMLGILLGLWIISRLIKFYGLEKQLDYFYNLFFYGLLGAIIGARLWHVVVEFSYYSAHPSDIYKIWQGGLASHGALLGGLLTAWLVTRYYQSKNLLLIKFSQLLDLLAPVLALMHIFVRLGNYFNQELFGAPTRLPWGIPIEFDKRPDTLANFVYFHPTFLYELLFFLIIFIIISYWHATRLRKFNDDKPLVHGNIFAGYLLAYGLERFCVEFLRVDQSYIFLGLRLAQITSLVLVLLALIIIFYNKFKFTKSYVSKDQS